MFCRNCGLRLITDSKPFCTHCGSPVRASAQTPVKDAGVVLDSASGRRIRKAVVSAKWKTGRNCLAFAGLALFVCGLVKVTGELDSVQDRVYKGCYAWAGRNGMVADSSVRVFKDDATNKAADVMNVGEHLCGCMASKIANDSEITDQAKVEIAHDLETKNREDNQQLALVVARAGAVCQSSLMEQVLKPAK